MRFFWSQAESTVRYGDGQRKRLGAGDINKKGDGKVKTISKAIILPIFFIILLASCNSFVYPPRTKPTDVMETAIIEARTSFIETQKAIPTATATITLTPTSRPTFTPTPNLATSLAYPTNWVPALATLDNRAVRCDDGYELELPELIDYMSNDIWSIFTCSPKPKDFKTMWTPGVVDYSKRYTKILKTDFSQSWVIWHKDFLWSNRPNAFLSARRWTQDGNFVYLVPAQSPSGDGFSPSDYFRDSNELYRLNLNSGNFEIVLPYVRYGYSYTLSPNGQYLAYSMPDEKKVVHIKDMSNNDEQQIVLKGDYALTGAFAWSVDNAKLLFASAVNGWKDGNAGISIFMLTINNLHLQPILLNDRRLLIPFPQWKDGEHKDITYWADKNLLYVWSLDNMSVEYFSELALDVQSGNIVVMTTPNPSLIGTSTPKP